MIQPNKNWFDEHTTTSSSEPKPCYRCGDKRFYYDSSCKRCGRPICTSNKCRVKVKDLTSDEAQVNIRDRIQFEDTDLLCMKCVDYYEFEYIASTPPDDLALLVYYPFRSKLSPLLLKERFNNSDPEYIKGIIKTINFMCDLSPDDLKNIFKPL